MPHRAERPRPAAAELPPRGRTDTIGLIVEDVGNPFSAAIHRAVEEVARGRGCVVLAGSNDEDPQREQRLVRTLLDRGVDGIVLVPCGDDYGWITAEQQAGTAFAFADRAPLPLHADAVLSDSRAGARDGVAHLLAAGHRRIAFLGDDIRIQTARERYAGYCDSLTGAGVSISPDLVRTDLRTEAQAASATVDLLRSAAPTALFAAQNVVLIGAIRGLHQLGVQQRVALLGFDDLALAEVVQPAVSVLAQQPELIGHLAAQRLFARLDGDRSLPSVQHVATRLVARGSGELPG